MTPRRTLPHDVADRLRQAILAGELLPGERVRELALAAEYGVSRTPMREALRQVAAEGLVDLVPNKGASVAAPTADEARHAFEAVAGLEAQAAALFCERASEEERHRLRHLVAELGKRFVARDLPGYFTANEQVHALIVEGARNPVIAELHARLNARLRPARFQANMTLERWTAAVDEHLTMAHAMEARDGALAADLTRRHLDHRLYVGPQWEERRREMIANLLALKGEERKQKRQARRRARRVADNAAERDAMWERLARESRTMPRQRKRAGAARADAAAPPGETDPSPAPAKRDG